MSDLIRKSTILLNQSKTIKFIDSIDSIYTSKNHSLLPQKIDADEIIEIHDSFIFEANPSQERKRTSMAALDGA